MLFFSLLRIFFIRLAIKLIGLFLLFAGVPALAETDSTETQAQTVYHADLFSNLNPDGIMLQSGMFRRWSKPALSEYGMPGSYTQAGIQLGLNPAYVQAGVYGEWMPALFAKMRLQYDCFHFNGSNGSLLSFSSAAADYGDRAREALSDRAETGWGQRILLQPELRVKAGPLLVRNTTDLAYYRFNGRGPYFLEQEYDTLLKDGDYLLNNRTALLLTAWRKTGSPGLLAGPFYEWTHADLDRQRVGVQFFWTPSASKGILKHSRLYGQIGKNIEDRNRGGEFFFSFGIGFDLNKLK